MNHLKQEPDAILLLGLELSAHDEPEPELILRVRAAAQAHRAYPGAKLIACGGMTEGHTRSEADVMAQLLEQEGVPRGIIVLENESRTTMENFVNAARILGGSKKRVLVVTSDYHVFRSVLTARRVGLRAKGYPVAMAHDEAWKQKRAKEIGYMVDLLMGWQDEGRTRPQWTYRLFDAVFGKRK